MRKQADLKVPKELQPLYDEIAGMTDAVCKEHLNGEYAELARKMTAALCRKRPSPLLSGRPKTWAGAILYTLGRINFLSDKSTEPYMRLEDLCKACDVSSASASTKSSQIWKTLKLMQLHPDWCLTSMLDSNPLVWMLSVNGFLVDVRHMPREVQEEAYRKGLIPYIPE